MHLCELSAESAVNAVPTGRPSTLVTVKTLHTDADEKARCVNFTTCITVYGGNLWRYSGAKCMHYAVSMVNV